MSFRFGGDEFLAIALDETLDQVQAKSDQILSNLKKQGYHVSIGIKQAQADHLNVSDLLYQYYTYDCRQKAGLPGFFYCF